MNKTKYGFILLTLYPINEESVNSRACARYLVFDISAYENAKRFHGILYKIANKYIDVRM